jgi:ribonuclease HIII
LMVIRMVSVLKVDKERIKKLKETLLRNKLVTELATTNAYEAFRVKCGRDTIVAYTSGKIVAAATEAKGFFPTHYLAYHKRRGFR